MTISKIIPLALILFTANAFSINQEIELATLLLTINPVNQVKLTNAPEVQTKPSQIEKARTMVQCPHCNRKFTKRGLTRHINSAHKSSSPKIKKRTKYQYKKRTKYKCNGCSFRSYKKAVVEQHMKRMQ